MAETNMLQEITKGLTTMSLNEPEPATISSQGMEPAVSSEAAFSRLPAEMRNQIYELVFRQTYSVSRPGPAGNMQTGISQNVQSSEGTEASGSTPPAQKPNPVALLEVNRQIYNETRLLPFHLGTLTVLDYYKWFTDTNGGPSYLSFIKHTLKSLRTWQRAEIRHLELGVTPRVLKLFIWKEYNVAMRSGDRNNRGFRQLFQILAQLNNDASTNPEVLGEVGHWIAGHLPGLTALETVSIAGTDIAISRERTLSAEVEENGRQRR